MTSRGVKYESGIESYFVLGVAPRGKRKRAVVVLQAFCDESGTDPRGTSCAVVGYLTDTTTWGRFEGEWREATGGETFHAIDFFGRMKDGKRSGQLYRK